MDRHLMTLRTRVYPSVGQAEQWRGWLAWRGQVERAALMWPHLVPRWSSFGALVEAVAAGAVPLVPVVARPVSRERLEEVVASARADVPEAAWPGVMASLHRWLLPLAGRRVDPAGLPAVTTLPLDGAVHAVGEVHVHIAGLRERVIADVYRLPLGVSAALLEDGARHVRGVQAALRAAQAADLAGKPGALHDLVRLAAREGPLLDLPPDAGGQAAGVVQRARHATLHVTRDAAGEEVWWVAWSFRVPGAWLPAAAVRDTVGVDLGLRQLLTWADGTGARSVPRTGLSTGGWAPPAGLESPLGAALVRRAQFRRHAVALDRALLDLLRYECVAIEDTHWAGFGPAGRDAAREALHLCGLTDVQAWLRSLGRVTGTRVIRVPPGHSSHRCAACGAPGTCAGTQFRCGRCGVTADRDVNAAGWFRRQALRT